MSDDNEKSSKGGQIRKNGPDLPSDRYKKVYLITFTVETAEFSLTLAPVWKKWEIVEIDIVVGFFLFKGLQLSGTRPFDWFRWSEGLFVSAEFRMLTF